MKGFTLIELVIVVAIIGIMIIFAVPLYQGYVARSQLTSIIDELGAARMQYELNVEDNATSDEFTVENLSLSTTSTFCTYTVYIPVSGVAEPAIECKLKNVMSSLIGKSIYLNRQQDGKWSCTTSANIPTNFKPAECS